MSDEQQTQTPLAEWAHVVAWAKQRPHPNEYERTIADLADHATAQQQRIAELEAQLAEAQAEAAQMGAAYLTENRVSDSLELQLEDAKSELKQVKAGTWQPVDSVKCACDDPGCRVRAFFEPPDKLIVTDGKNTVSILYVANHIRLCQLHPAPAEPEPISQEAQRQSAHGALLAAAEQAITWVSAEEWTWEQAAEWAEQLRAAIRAAKGESDE